MSIASLWRSLWKGLLDGSDQLPSEPHPKDVRIAALDATIKNNLKAIEQKADSSPEALNEATLCLDSITLNLKKETDRLREGSST